MIQINLFTKLLRFSCSVMSDSLWHHGLQLPCPSVFPRVCSDTCSLSRWCYLTISSPAPSSPSAFSLFQHQNLFQWVDFSHQMDKVLELQLQYWSFEWIFRIDILHDWLVWSWGPRVSQEFSPAWQFKSISSSMLSLLYGPALTSVHDYWKNRSFDYMDLCQQSNVSAFQYAV